MRTIKGILIDPVGCLAEFPAEEFNEIAAKLFDRKKKTSKSGSRAYWQLLNLMQTADKNLNASERKAVEDLELKAVESATLYEDVVPALSELKAMNIKLLIASSLSNTAVMHFLEKFSLKDFFSDVWTRDNAKGVKAAPLASAMDGASFKPEEVMVLVETTEGIRVAKEVGVNSILMMDDYDEARTLAMRDPSGGIISLSELPDFLRLVVAENENLPKS